MPGTSSFPFPSSAASSSKSLSTSAVLQDNIEDGAEKSAFGFDSTARIPIPSNTNGDDEESNLLVNDEYAEDQVYGKVYPMPDNVTVITGEEDEDCVIQIRAKLFRLSVPNDSSVGCVEPSQNIPSSGSIDCLLHDSALASDKNEKEKSEGEKNVQIIEVNPCAISTENIEKDFKENLERKKKVLGEWIEVGIGPVRILQQRDSPTSHSNEVSHHNHTAINNILNKRMVMRREDKKGGKGDISFFLLIYLTYFFCSHAYLLFYSLF